MPEGKIEHIADDQALGHILRRKRLFAIEIVLVLHLPHTARFAHSSSQLVSVSVLLNSLEFV